MGKHCNSCCECFNACSHWCYCGNDRKCCKETTPYYYEPCCKDSDCEEIEQILDNIHIKCVKRDDCSVYGNENFEIVMTSGYSMFISEPKLVKLARAGYTIREIHIVSGERISSVSLVKF